MAKYIDADLLRKEIKKLEKLEYPCDTYEQGVGFRSALDRVLDLIDTLQQEQLSEDLEKEQERNLDFQCFAKEMDSVFALPAPETTNTKDEPLNWEYAIARHFAEWQKEQMLKDAVEGVVYRYESYQRIATAIIVDLPREGLGNKVKIIIVKED